VEQASSLLTVALERQAGCLPHKGRGDL